MGQDIIIQNESVVLDSLSELSTSHQNLCSIYAEIQSILNAVGESWVTNDLGGDSNEFKTKLKRNIDVMTGQVLPSLKQFNQVINDLIAQYRAQQK